MPRILVPALLTSVAVSALPTAPLLAQPVQLDPIFLVAGKAEPAEKAGSTILTKEEIDAASTGTLSDLFRATPSVSVGGGIALTQKMFVNGVDQQQLAVSVDGVSQNNRMFHHTGTNVIDPGLLKAVDVSAGVAPADAGPAALGGAVRFETKSARDMLEADGVGGSTALSYGSNGRTATGAVTLYGVSGAVDALVFVKRATGDNYKDGAGKVVKGTGADLTSGLVKLGVQSNGWRAEYSAMQVKDDALRPWRANIGGVTGGRPTPELRRYGLTQTTQALTFSRVDGDGMLDPELQIAQSSNHLDVPEPYKSKGNAKTFSVTAKNTFHLANGMRVTAGVDLQNRKTTYDDATTSVAERVRNSGLFAQLRGAAGTVDYSAGLRYDWNRFTGVNGQKIATKGASANVSANWHVTDALSVNAGVATTFGGVALASSFDLDRFAKPGSYDSVTSARSRNAVLGVEWQQDGITLGGELFRTEIDRARKLGKTVDVESKGYRLSAGYDWQSGSAMLRYVDAKLTVNGKGASTYDLLDLGTPSGRSLTLEFNHRATEDLTIGGVVEKAFDLRHSGADTDRNIKGYAVVDIFADYKPASMQNLSIRAEVNNLFDASYASRASYGGDYASITPQREPGRNVALTANFSF